MLLSLLLATAAATATPPKPPAGAPPKAGSLSLDMIPPFIGACMNNGPDVEKMRAAIIKAGGQAAPQQAGKSATDPSRLEAYLFAHGGVPYSIIFDRRGSCSVVTGRADLDVTRASLDRLVIGSSKVFDVSQTEGKPHAKGETVVAEYRLKSKEGNGGLLITLSRVTQEGKGTAVFLTRRIFAK
jgi:hypothetical protein